jgi:hypothetical protein
VRAEKLSIQSASIRVIDDHTVMLELHLATADTLLYEAHFPNKGEPKLVFVGSAEYGIHGLS